MPVVIRPACARGTTVFHVAVFMVDLDPDHAERRGLGGIFELGGLQFVSAEDRAHEPDVPLFGQVHGRGLRLT